MRVAIWLALLGIGQYIAAESIDSYVIASIQQLIGAILLTLSAAVGAYVVLTGRD